MISNAQHAESLKIRQVQRIILTLLIPQLVSIGLAHADLFSALQTNFGNAGAFLADRTGIDVDLSKGQVETRTPVVIGGTAGEFGGAVQTTLRDGAKGLEDNLKTGLGDAEKPVQHVSDVAADVVTAGGHGRDRDLAAANAAKELEEEKARKAEELNNEAKRLKRAEIANALIRIKDLGSHIEHLNSLRASAEKSIKLNETLATKAIGVENRDQTLSIVMNSQLTNLIEWVDQSEFKGEIADGVNREVNQTRQDLIAKISKYRSQLAQLPVPPDQANTADIIDDVIRAGYAVLEVIDSSISETTKVLEQETRDKEQKQAELESLG